GVAQVDIQTARRRVHGAELAVRQRAEQRQQPADHPDDQRRTGIAAGLADDAAGDEEDARADHRADHDQDEIAEIEHAGERAVRQGGLPYHFSGSDPVRAARTAAARNGPLALDRVVVGQLFALLNLPAGADPDRLVDHFEPAVGRARVIHEPGDV